MSADDTIKSFKQVKVPFWARWLGAYRAWQRRRNAHKEIHYVCTGYTWTHWVGAGTDVEYSRQWYILKTDGAGRRFYEYGYDHPYLKHKETLHSVYASTIAPWV